MGRHKKQRISAHLAILAQSARKSAAWMCDTIADLRAPALNGAKWQTDEDTLRVVRQNASEILESLLGSHQGAKAC